VRNWSEAKVRSFAARILKRVREGLAPVPDDGGALPSSQPPGDVVVIDDNRLPGWFQAANVRAGWIGPTLVVVFEDASGLSDGDTYRIYGEVKADTAVLLDSPGLDPVTWLYGSLQWCRRVAFARYGQDEEPVVIILPDRAALYALADFPNHGPLGLFWFFFQMSGAGDQASMPVLTRFVPATLYVSLDDDVEDLDTAARWFADSMHQQAIAFAGSAAGERRAQTRTILSSFETSKKRSVIVLGSYSSQETGGGDELVRVRDYLLRRGYDATLIRDLPEIPEMSNKDKVRMWTSAARFCVMVDRTPSGHVAEYEMLLTQKTLLALLRPPGRGSTSMIGDDPLVDVNHVKAFPFATSPLEKLEDSIAWAEDMIRQRSDAYNQLYGRTKKDPEIDRSPQPER
jgi:hypothetical protein